jgi:uncharacterized phiE125 gp8 family phage protein
MVITLVPAAVLPASITELKDLLRIDHHIEDALLAGLLRAATDVAENFLGQVLVQQQYEQRAVRPESGQILLERGPLVTVVSVVADGAPLSADDYDVETTQTRDNYVTVQAVNGAEVIVRFSAGVAQNWNELPEQLRFGILRQAAHLYMHRDSAAVSSIPSAVLALWQPYRRVQL